MIAWQIKLAAVLLIVAALFGAYKWVGYHAVSEYKQGQAVLQAKDDKAQQDKYNKLAADYEAAKANREVVFKTTTKRVETIVDRPVYHTSCIDSEGLGEANKALAGDLL